MLNPDQISRILSELTPRQSQILFLVCSGWEYPAIAVDLHISEHTVQSDMSKMYKRFGMKGESMPKKRQRLGSEVCPIHLRKYVQSNTPIDDTDSEPADEKDVEEVKRDAQSGLIPIRALIVVDQPSPTPPRGGLSPRPPYPPVGPPTDKRGGTCSGILIGVLATLLVLLIGLIAAALTVAREPLLRYLQNEPITVVVSQSPVPVVVSQAESTPDPSGVVTPVAQPSPSTPEPSPIPATPTVQPTITPRVQLPFTDDFDNGIRPEWIRAGGDWSMSNGRLTNSGNKAIVWLGKSDWKDIVVEADVEGWSCTLVTGGIVEILVHMQDPSNYIAVKTAGCGGNGIAVVRNGDYVYVTSGGGGGSHYKVEVVGNVIKVEADGQPLWSASDEAFGSGSVGLRAEYLGFIDNVTIRPYIP